MIRRRMISMTHHRVPSPREMGHPARSAWRPVEHVDALRVGSDGHERTHSTRFILFFQDFLNLGVSQRRERRLSA